MMALAFIIAFVFGLIFGFFAAGVFMGKHCDGSLEIDGDDDSIKLSKMVIDVDIKKLIEKDCLILRLVNRRDDL